MSKSNWRLSRCSPAQLRQSMMRVARRRRGFTATELMVTMGVLGIVGALSWGGMSGLMESR
ncbi:MAG: hypothetical protein CME07_04050, partial [Gemmatimonadetes bacterium]|nr:hypothetical protein [Gemmatimonadota bacterium]